MEIRGTTIIGVEKDGKRVIAGDGQATLGEHIIFKANTKKVKRIYNDKVVVGFAGATADAFTLVEKFEKFLKKYSGNLMRASIELAQEWRSDQGGRKLDTMMIVADKDNMLVITGVGDVMEPDNGICSIGSGSNFALAAGRALKDNTNMSAREIAEKAMDIASDYCVYTNKNLTIEEV